MIKNNEKVVQYIPQINLLLITFLVTIDKAYLLKFTFGAK